MSLSLGMTSLREVKVERGLWRKFVVSEPFSQLHGLSIPGEGRRRSSAVQCSSGCLGSVASCTSDRGVRGKSRSAEVAGEKPW